MAKQRSGFLIGCEENNIDKDLAGNIFDLVEKFAGYGFNKSHSAAYALLSYQTAWLKCHHPAAFMAAVLSADMDNTDKVVVLIEECNSMGLTVKPPSVNHSQVRFSVLDDNTVVYGLGAIRGVGEAALSNVLVQRDENGPFNDLDDLCSRADQGTVNKRVLEALIKAGAADELGPNRASLMAYLADALHGAEQMHRDNAAGQNDLFGLDGPIDGPTTDNSDNTTVVIPLKDDWTDRQRLAAEKDTLGLYLSGHPINEFKAELEKFTHGSLKTICAKATPTDNNMPGYRQKGVPVIAAGLVMAVRFRDIQGRKMAFITLDDKTGRVEISLSGELIDSHAHLIVKDEVLVVDGDVSPDDFNGGYKIRAREIYDLAQARSRFARRLVINLKQEQLKQNGLADLVAALSHYKSGSTPVCFQYDNGQARARIQAGQLWWVNPQDELLTNLNQLAGEGSAELVY